MNKSARLTPNSAQVRGSKGIALLFLVVVIVLVAIGGILYYSWQKRMIKTTTQEAFPTPTAIVDETANWKAYINEKYNFTFNYPADVELTETPSNVSLYRWPEDPHADENILTVGFRIISNSEKITPETYARLYLCLPAKEKESKFLQNLYKSCQKLLEENLKTYENNKIKGIKTVYNYFETPHEAVIFSGKIS